MARRPIAHRSAQFRLRATILGLSLLATMAAGHAQAPVAGAFSGTVVDSSSRPLPGTSVTITSPVIPTGQRSTVADEHGMYQFTQLPAGAYGVTFVLDGFERLVIERLTIVAGKHVNVTSSMTPGAIEERQHVAGGAVAIDSADPGAARPDQNGVSGASDNRDRDVPPQRLVTVLPRFPRDAARGTAGTVSVMFTLDASGRPYGVQPAPEYDLIGLRDVDRVLTAALEPGPEFRTAAVDAVSQWVYEEPAEGELTLIVQFAFLAERRVRLASQRVFVPVQAGVTSAGRLQVGTTR